MLAMGNHDKDLYNSDLSTIKVAKIILKMNGGVTYFVS